jgi:hypothetical protein
MLSQRMGGESEEEEGMGTEGEIRRATPVGRWLRRLTLLSVRRRARLPAAYDEAPGREAALAEAASGEPEKRERGSKDLETSARSAGYAAYGDFIKDELDVQDKRKASFEQRGVAVITTSGTLVTLLFALAALSTKHDATFTLPASARTWLFIALPLFFVSALAALLSNAPLLYQAVPAPKIRDRLREKPPRDAEAAAKDVAFSRLDALESAKKMNSIKGWALAVAMGCEALAIGCVAVAIGFIL